MNVQDWLSQRVELKQRRTQWNNKQHLEFGPGECADRNTVGWMVVCMYTSTSVWRGSPAMFRFLSNKELFISNSSPTTWHLPFCEVRPPSSLHQKYVLDTIWEVQASFIWKSFHFLFVRVDCTFFSGKWNEHWKYQIGRCGGSFSLSSSYFIKKKKNLRITAFLE